MTATENSGNGWPYNLAMLTWHCFKKGVQLGSVIGCALVAPISYYRTRSKEVLLRRLFYSIGVGAIFAVGMMTIKVASWENKSLCLEDRVFRIHNNAGQNRTDLFSVVAFGSSFGLGTYLTHSVVAGIGITAPATVLALLAHLATKS